MLQTNLYDNIDYKKENANDLFDELALVNPFTNVKEKIEDNYAKKAKNESPDQNPGTSNQIDLWSKSLAENAKFCRRNRPAICWKTPAGA